MVRIRLRRQGLKKQSTYRIVAADKESPRNGRFLEILGSYNPRTEPFTLDIDEERVYRWLGNGAQPSDSVEKIFKAVELDKRFESYKAAQTDEAKAAVVADAKAYYEKRAVELKTRAASKK